MTTQAIKELICDRCAKMIVLRKGDEHGRWGTLHYRRINGEGSDKIGGEALPADLCEECANGLMKWWRRQT